MPNAATDNPGTFWQNLSAGATDLNADNLNAREAKLASAVVNIRDYKQSGDGSDWFPAYGRALTALKSAGGGTLYVPGASADYVTSGTWLIDANGIHIRGGGRNAARVKLANNTTITGGATANVVETAIDTFFCSLSDITIDGNYANQAAGTDSGNGVVLKGCTGFQVLNCHLKSTRRFCIDIRGTSGHLTLDTSVYGCRIEDSGTECFSFAGFAATLGLVDCIIGGSRSEFNTTIENNDTRIVGCHFHNGAIHGLRLNGGRNHQVIGCHVESNKNHGISCEGANDIIVQGCVSVKNSRNSTANAADGINVSSGTNISILGNRCHDESIGVQRYGINVTGGTNVLVANNNTQGNVTGGLNNPGGATLSANL